MSGRSGLSLRPFFSTEFIMLDANLKNQLQSYMERITLPIEIVA